MKWVCLLILICVFFRTTYAENLFEVKVVSQEELRIGSVRRIRVEILNRTGVTVAILEVRPKQPCEDPVSLVRTLYGKIDYDEQADEYFYDAMPQQSTLIPVIEGFLEPGDVLWLNLDYRPFDTRETFQIDYSTIVDQKVYAKVRGESEVQKFSPTGTDFSQVIITPMIGLEKKRSEAPVVFEEITGEKRSSCYCEILQRTDDRIPPSLCKEWDSGNPVLFRVGEEQEGIEPDDGAGRPADWNFLDEYPVFYGDGMYTHGEFIRISPQDARAFIEKILGKYHLNRVSYFFSKYYYDLEPIQ